MAASFGLECEILDPRDRVNDYVARFLPQKIAIDLLYLERRTFSTDLKTWVAISTNVITSNTNLFIDTLSPQPPYRFYRLSQCR